MTDSRAAARIRRRSLRSAALLALVVAARPAPSDLTDQDAVQEGLRNRIEAAGTLPAELAVGGQRIHAVTSLPTFYERRAYRPAWSDGRRPLPVALAFLDAIRGAAREGLRADDYHLAPIEVARQSLNGYRIGSYPARALRSLAIYRPPRGFIEVTPENHHALVAPHFTLGQFLCKQESGWPKYVVLQERLLLKLELILAAANEQGYRARSLVIMSGYRTPFYNRAIGNVQYSRHVWGGAADIYIDESPRDGTMDDLNRDGHIDYRDAGVLYDLIDRMYGQPWYAPFLGGLGRYKKTASHGPFVHVDVRGFRARWGT